MDQNLITEKNTMLYRYEKKKQNKTKHTHIKQNKTINLFISAKIRFIGYLCKFHLCMNVMCGSVSEFREVALFRFRNDNGIIDIEPVM